MEYSALRPIVDLLPGYAHTRRRGWVPASGVTDPALSEYLLLRRVAIERDDRPITYAQLCVSLRDPYSTVNPMLDGLQRLIELGLLRRSGDAYALTTLGRDVLMRNEPAANDYAADRICLSPADLARLAAILHDVTERQWHAPEPSDKSHQDRVPRLRSFDLRPTPAVQLEYAIYALQRARDDAHISAWRAAGFRGPELELLSQIWANGPTASSNLARLTNGRIRSQDIEGLLDGLERADCIDARSATVRISDHGRNVRDAIERETDRVYFTPWPEIDAEWVRDRLEVLVAGLAPRIN